jgi:hypothetical protein
MLHPKRWSIFIPGQKPKTSVRFLFFIDFRWA